MITINELIIGYQKPLLQVDQLILNAGEVYALVGRNGIGKSTFIQTLLGLRKSLGGNIRIEDRDIHSFTSKELSERISFVETRFEGIEYLKVSAYLALGRAPYTDAFGRLSADDWNLVQHVANKLAITHLLDKYTDQISDGERQLCAVGRAFVQDTPMILLDEPTAFLDYLNRKKLLELLVSFAKEQGKCLVVSSHDLELCLDQDLPLLVAANGKISLFKSIQKAALLELMA
mgnify:CR=1 FL=1